MIFEVAIGVYLSARVSGFLKSAMDYLKLYNDCLNADLVVARKEIRGMARGA